MRLLPRICSERIGNMTSVYDFSVTRRDGSELQLSSLRGKVIMIVNTATGCGFTPQYEPLEKMYGKYHEKGLEIIADRLRGAMTRSMSSASFTTILLSRR